MHITSIEYEQLVSICLSSDTFFFVDQRKDDKYFRIFNYRLANYSDWLIHPLTFDMRGLMIETDDTGCFIRVASRPPSKFFNLEECPLTMNLNLEVAAKVCDKLDGSLISTFIYQDNNNVIQLGLKSKGSLYSDQCMEAYSVLETNMDMAKALKEASEQNLTVYCEICSPSNRIVIGYHQPQLTVLGVRDNVTGRELSSSELPMLSPYWVSEIIVDNVASFLPSIKTLEGKEGYVILLLEGDNANARFKIKTPWYMSLHHAKDSITNPRRLFEAILDEGVDDLRSMFAHDALAMSTIDEMQTKVSHMYNHVVTLIETFYEQHKSDDRKTYAIAAQTMSVQGISLLGLLMQKFLGRPCDVKEFLKGKYKELGFKDTSIAVE